MNTTFNLFKLSTYCKNLKEKGEHSKIKEK